MNKSLIFLYIFVFIIGAAIMGIEMTAPRILAPFFGASIFVWANIIGLVMLGLAIGYFLGGKIADRYPKKNVLFSITLTAGALSALIPLVSKPILSFVFQGLSDINLLVILGSFISTVILFMIPIVLLGFVSPYSVRLATEQIQKVGRSSGSLYATSTMGSIVGTFITSFIIIPFLGSRESILIFSFLIILVSLFGLRQKRFLVLLFFPLVFYPWSNKVIKDSPGMIYEKETPYQYIQVIQKEDMRYLMVNEGGGYQSLYNLKDILTDTYFDYFSLLPYLYPDQIKKDVLIIGLAGGTMARQYSELLSSQFKLDIDGVEIDPEMNHVAKEYFDLDNQALDIYNLDGRSFLNTTNKKYDIIIIDAYSQQIYIPFHLTTQEFFKEVKNHLTSKGIMAINVNALSLESEILTSLASTIRASLGKTYILPISNTYNYLVIGSPCELDFEGLKKVVPKLEDLANYSLTHLSEFNANGKILTDDKAPVEFMTEKMIFEALINDAS